MPDEADGTRAGAIILVVGGICSYRMAGAGFAGVSDRQAGRNGGSRRFVSGVARGCRTRVARPAPSWQLEVWQSRFHDHVVRNDRDLERIRKYIRENPSRWAFDHENPANYFGARPVLVDVDARSLNLDIEGVRRGLTPATKAIIPVHFAGLPVGLDSLHALAAKHGLAVIEDAAHALPAWHRGRIVGALSDFTCFSFYATKGMTTGEGGIVCTGSPERAERCRIMALHGISRDAWKRYRDGGSWYYEIVAPGYKYNLTDIAAAIGLVQLKKAESMWGRRKQIAEMYDAAFGPLDALEVPYRNEHSEHSWHLYPLRLHLDRLRVTRADAQWSTRRSLRVRVSPVSTTSESALSGSFSASINSMSFRSF